MSRKPQYKSERETQGHVDHKFYVTRTDILNAFTENAEPLQTISTEIFVASSRKDGFQSQESVVLKRNTKEQPGKDLEKTRVVEAGSRIVSVQNMVWNT